jgi:hypothetical protein
MHITCKATAVVMAGICRRGMSLAESLRFSSSRMRKTSVTVERIVSVGDSEIWPDEPNAMVQVRATKKEEGLRPYSWRSKSGAIDWVYEARDTRERPDVNRLNSRLVSLVPPVSRMYLHVLSIQHERYL